MEGSADILILTAQFGNGHISVANALKQWLLENNSTIKINVEDFFKTTKPKAYNRIYKNYEYLVKHGSWIYNSYYYSKEKFEYLKKLDTGSLLIHRKLKNYLEANEPKVIISTFPVCSGYVSKYKEQYNKQIPLVTVITDIVATNEWIYPYTDLYLVATKEVKKELIKKGVQEEKIQVTGIPIRRSFYEKCDTYALPLLNKIPRDKKVVTFLGGGLGLLPKDKHFYQWLSRLEDIHCMIITGKNQKLYKKLCKHVKYDNISIMGYTNKIDEIMKRSDFLVGKPGGITLFEAIVTQVPCIVLKPSLGQEKENCKYIEEQEIGIIIKEPEDLHNALDRLLSDKEVQAAYKERLNRIREDIDIKSFLEKVSEWL